MSTDLFGNEIDEAFAGTAEEAIDWRRTGAPYSIGVPVAEAKDTFPLFHPKGNGVFDHIDLTFLSKNDGQPTIVYGQPIYTTSKEGRSWRFQATSLLTLASKMACPSFSLPAGTPARGGSCTAAGATAFRKKGLTYTCDICYALKGNYFYPNVGTAQIARLMFVKKSLQEDPSGDHLADVFVTGITDFARGKVRMDSRSFSTRMAIEIGSWDEKIGRVCVTAKHGRDEERYQTFKTRLPSFAGYESSAEFFASRKPKDGEVTGFFRIHDSGDFTIGNNALSLAYLRAWEKTAQVFPNVIFWAPTRAWKFPFMAKELERISASTKNLIVRPSAFNVGEEAPEVTGFVAGTTVARAIGKHSFERMDAYLCPVAKMENKDCLSVGCRACWMMPDLKVAYGEH